MEATREGAEIKSCTQPEPFFFFPLPFGGFLSLVPMPINCTGSVYKDISDPNANHGSNVDHKTIVSKELHESKLRSVSFFLLSNKKSWVFYV